VSSAYFDIKLPRVIDCRSDAVTTYEASPIAESWVMLAVIWARLRLLAGMSYAV